MSWNWYTDANSRIWTTNKQRALKSLGEKYGNYCSQCSLPDLVLVQHFEDEATLGAWNLRTKEKTQANASRSSSMLTRKLVNIKASILQAC